MSDLPDIGTLVSKSAKADLDGGPRRVSDSRWQRCRFGGPSRPSLRDGASGRRKGMRHRTCVRVVPGTSPATAHEGRGLHGGAAVSPLVAAGPLR